MDKFYLVKYEIRITFVHMNDERDKRVPKSYKVKESVYCAAFAAAHLKGTTLAEEVEKFVTRYANGKKKIIKK